MAGNAARQAHEEHSIVLTWQMVFGDGMFSTLPNPISLSFVMLFGVSQLLNSDT